MNIVIVTSCPSGIANSVIAAGLLEKAAASLGWNAVVECHNNIEPAKLLTVDEISTADLVVVAGDNIDLARFTGKRVYQAGVMDAIPDAKAFLQTAAAAATVTSAEAVASQQTQEKPKVSPMSKRIVAITACPTGVAHTFMAAEALEEEAKKRGYWIKVETRGSVGAKNALTAEEIAQADVVIIAADIELDLSRFAGKKLYKTSTGAALKKTAQEMDHALATQNVFQGGASAAASHSGKAELPGVYKHLMTGVSHMLPIVVAGGLLIALSFVFGIEAFKEEGTMAAALMKIGGASAFALMVPVMAGFIAFSIADRPGLAPGLIGGMLASSIGAGFLGGIVAGFIAGYAAKAIADNVKLPQTMEALKPILIIPLFASLITGLAMIYVVGTPIASIMKGLTDFLTGMSGANAILLGIILGAMMCFDLGGPVNKVAYVFGTGLLASNPNVPSLPMAAVMAAGMVPAIGMGIATFVARNKFIDSEREAGKASFVLGLCFISEGAIPFAARDPMRVIPSTMAGGALAGALSMLFGCGLMAPHGGLFVLLIPGAISNALMYIVAIAAGSALTGLMYATIKPSQEVQTA
ncbi:PTS system, fructose subfamily, IIC subunit [Tolumonas auensis DSM 9187]|uniref:protein-N(pi)-phosphohistidine--D-fructose phosphotransferase n=1 Tax=Tolumonas auensis (strain DSM 9187 / NBRC 110442 / TA 4) TaxID=595494 RepID=C4L8P6_TOLAT|nr:PTS fructose-like transporter subunit IIB [Tolumonas auensis]ACQ91916.1 PTS system, fructose subfamily, IIC subunit [Tolumonas auensis DSM 9187]